MIAKRPPHWFSPTAAGYGGVGVMALSFGSLGWGALWLVIALCVLHLEGRLEA